MCACVSVSVCVCVCVSLSASVCSYVHMHMCACLGVNVCVCVWGGGGVSKQVCMLVWRSIVYLETKTRLCTHMCECECMCVHVSLQNSSDSSTLAPCSEQPEEPARLTDTASPLHYTTPLYFLLAQHRRVQRCPHPASSSTTSTLVKIADLSLQQPFHFHYRPPLLRCLQAVWGMGTQGQAHPPAPCLSVSSLQSVSSTSSAERAFPSVTFARLLRDEASRPSHSPHGNL